MRIPVPGAIFLFIFSFLIDWIIYSDIRKYSSRRWARFYAVSSVICWLYLTVILFYPLKEAGSDILPVMWMLFAYISLYLAKTVYAIFSLIGRIPALWRGRQFKSGLWLGLPFGLLTFLMMWWGVFETRHEIEVNRVDVVSDRLPSGFNGYTIAQFSDSHVGTWGQDTVFISNLVDSINALHPDLIVFTGDIVNRQTSELKPFLKVLSRLHAKDGVISVLGNHDYGDYMNWKSDAERDANNDLLAKWERNMGWKLLNNRSLFIRQGNDSIAIIGVENWGEPPFRQYGNLKGAYPSPGDTLHSLTDSEFKILLSHNPEHWNREVSKSTNIDLTLSGHTHAMQFMLKFGRRKWSPSQYRYPQWAGMYDRLTPFGNTSHLYVNIGNGEVAMPFRIGAVPEITLLTLKAAPRASQISK